MSAWWFELMRRGRWAAAMALAILVGSVGGDVFGRQPVADAVWQPVSQAARPAAADARVARGGATVMRFSKPAFDAFMNAAPDEAAMRSGTPLVMSLPLPDGTFSRFTIAESPILAPALAAAFPEIRTFTGVGIDDPTASTRFGWTAEGFHAIVITAAGTAYIDPVQPDDRELYLVAAKASRPQPENPFVCLLNGTGRTGQEVGQRALNTFPIIHGDSLRTYRLALAATFEYTAASGTPGTKATALARMVATMNRVNGIYERELAVRMTLFTGPAGGNTTALIYDTVADPYTDNDPMALLDENQLNVDAVMTTAGYDIGHVFGATGGGVAALGSPCDAGSKAQGVTGTGGLTGDPFDVDYVAHEIGHQFGGNHTFNGNAGNCGTRSGSNAYEVGSGSTIQAYAGICDAENLQPNTSDYFHVESLNEMTAFITSGGGATCGTSSATGNTPPTVSTTAAFTIPKQTPFTLTATGADANGHALTYAWEEYDLGDLSNSVASASDGTANRPLFRSYAPSSSPSRTFPRLDHILNTANVPPPTYSCGAGTCLTGEVLPNPAANRPMNFKVTARDNRAGGGGINTAQTIVTVSSASGPFLVTSPNTAVTLTGGDAHTVTWNVANTSAAPVSAANVRILMSTDGGTTFGTELLASTPNDGNQSITLPNITTTTARIKVEAVDNVFFDISNTNFTINAAQLFTATLTGAQQAPPVTTTATGSGTVTLNNAENQITVNMNFSGLSSAVTDAHIHGPAAIGANAGVLFPLGDVTPLATSGTNTVKTFAITAPQVVDLKAGLYYFNIHTGTNPGGEIRGQITAVTVPGAPTIVGALGGNGQATVTFTAPSSNGGAAISSYTVTASPGGATATGLGSSLIVTGLTNGTAYTFTITATNSVGTSPASSPSAAVTPATVPGAPTAVSGVAGNGQVTVGFTAPVSNGGSAITGYTVTASPGGATGTGSGTSIVVSGLTNGTAYTFTVTAANSVGTGAASSASSAVTPTSGNTAPGAPTGVVGTAGNGQVSVAFTAPSSNGGSAITGYTVTASPGGATGTGTGSPIVVSGLTNGTAYTFTVTATNSVGTGIPSTASAAVTPIVPSITGAPATLTFTATKGGAAGGIVSVTSPQNVAVTYAGGSAPAWTATANQPWVLISNASGIGNGTFTVAIYDPTNVIAGSTSLPATITITSTTGPARTSTVALSLTVKQNGTSTLPFGSFDTPIAGAAVEGSIAVTGWALDDVEVARVEIWRDAVAGETTPLYPGPGPGTGKIYIADPVFVTGARPDVEAGFPTMPLANRAGWGYLLLTQGLWNQGNGPYTLYAFAYDREGRSTVLGSKAITVNNAAAVRPFGSIDVPAYGQTMTTSFYNFGWALTPNATPSCSVSTVQVSIDSGPLQPVSYGDPRPDIAAAFPGFSNGAGAGGAYYIDISTLANGSHQIGWYVVDSCGRAEGVGSRFFSVLTASSTVPLPSRPTTMAADAVREVVTAPVIVRRDLETVPVEATDDGHHVVTIRQDERVEVELPATGGAPYVGYQIVNGTRRALPEGASLDGVTGQFYWQPAAGFLGTFDLEFVPATGGLVRVRAVVASPQ